MEQRSYRFESNNPTPEINFSRKENFIIGSNKKNDVNGNNNEDDKNDNEQMKKNGNEKNMRKNEEFQETTRNDMFIRKCNLIMNSKISTAVLNVLRENKKWHTIILSSCSGDDTILKEIIQSNVKNLTIGEPRRSQSNIRGTMVSDTLCWRAFCQVISSSSLHTHLNSLSLHGLTFCQKSVKMLEDAYRHERQQEQQHFGNNIDSDSTKNRGVIRELILSSPSFQNGSQIYLASVIREYISPSLQSLSVSNFTSEDDPLLDEEFSKFLSTVLLVDESSTATNDPATGAKDTDNNGELNENRLFPLQKFSLCHMNGIGTKTMSVISKWLRPDVSSSISSVITIGDINNSNDIACTDNAMDDCTARLSRRCVHRRSLAILSCNQEYFLESNFSEALSQSKLESLDLSFGNNKLSEEAFANFCITLRHCKPYLKVLKLNLDFSTYPSSSIEELFKSIAGVSSSGSASLGEIQREQDQRQEQRQRQHPLVELNLLDCKLVDDNLRALSEQIHHFASLQTLNLASFTKRNRRHVGQGFSGDRIPTYLVTALAGAMKDNKLIHLVTLTINHVPDGYDHRYRKHLEYITDVNRGGRKFLFYQKEQSDTAVSSGGRRMLHYQRVKLWPYIFDRINHSMSLPPLHHDKEKYKRDIKFRKSFILNSNSKRRSSIIYYLLLHGAIVDCLTEGSSEFNNGSVLLEDQSTEANKKRKLDV